MNKRLWSGVMSGIMAVSSSVVLELPAAAENYVLIQTTLGSWESSDNNTIALGGISNSSSTILVTCTAPAGLKEDVEDDDGNKTGETKTPEEVCGIIFNGDWSSVIPVAYDSETGISTYTLTYDQFAGKRTIIIQNHTHSEIQVSVETVDFEADERETASVAAITDTIGMEISREDNSSWLVGNAAGTSIPDAALTGRFSGKTVGELRAALGKVFTPAINYVSDTAGAGKDAFVKQLYIDCDGGWFSTGEAQNAFALDEEGCTLIDGLFPDDSNDDLVINEIGTDISAACVWDGDLQSNRTTSEAINALPKGYNVFIETTEDNKGILELPAASGSIVMFAYTDESNTWLYGASAGGGFSLDSVDGVTYGTTTMKEFREKYKYIKMQDLPFFSSEVNSLAADQLCQNIGFSFEDDTYLGLRSNGTSKGNLYALIPGDESSLSDYDDKIITGINIDINVNTYYDEEKGLNVSVNSDVSALNGGSSFIVELTEDVRSELVLPASDRNNVMLHTYRDDNWGIIANGWFDLYPAEIVGKTVSEFAAQYKKVTLPALTFYKDGIGDTADCYDAILHIVTENDDWIGWANVPLTSESYIITDYLKDDIGSFGDSRITAVRVEIRSTIENDMAKSEIVRGMGEGEMFLLEFSEDTRDEIALPEASGEVMLNVFAEEGDWFEGLDAGGNLDIAAPEGITYGTTTLKQLKDDYKTISISEVPFFGCTLDGVTAADLMYTLIIDVRNGDDMRSVYYNNGSFAAAKASVDEMLNDISNPEDYVIIGINLFIRAKTEYNEETGKHHVVNDAIKSLSEGDSFTVVLTEDTRKNIALDPITQNTVYLNVYTDENVGGKTARTDIGYGDCEIIGKTVSELLADYKSISFAAPGYFADSAGAKSAAYSYRIEVTIDNDDQSDTQWLGWSNYALDKNDTLKFSTYSSVLDGREDYKVTWVNIVIESANNEKGAVSETIRALPDGSVIALELQKDARAEAEIAINPAKQIQMQFGTQDDTEGSYASTMVPVSTAYTEKTIAELKSSCKKITADGIPYIKDTEDYSAEDYAALFYILVETGNGEQGILSDEFELNKSAAWYTDFIDSSYDEYTIKETGVLILSRREENENGKLQAVNEKMRGEEIGKTYIVNPQSVKNFKAAAGNKTVTLTWDAVDYPGVCYNVYMIEGGERIMCGTAETNRFAVSDLETGTEYTFAVGVLTDDVEFVDAENTVSASPKEKLSAPANVKATAGDKQVTIAWDKLDGVVQYRIQRLNGTAWGTVATTSATSYINTGLTNGTSYSYRVLAFDGTNWGAVSAVVSASPKAGTIPQNVKATSGDKQVKITWNAVENATQYRIQRLNGTAWSTVGTVTSTSYTNTGLTNGTSYSYRVLALVDGKWSGVSATVTAKPAAASVPQNVKATAGDKQIKLTWSALSGATQYRIQRLNGTAWSTVGNVTTTSYTNTGLTNGTSYSYRVLALVNGKWSGVSATVTAKPAAASVPQNVKATAGDKQIKLTWSALSGATQYRIQRLNGTAWSTVGNVTTTSYTNTGLTNGTSYSYRVLALVNGKWSGVSATVTAKPAAASVPQNVKATAGDKQVKITWNALSGATQYRIQRLNGTAWSTVGNVTTTSYTNTGLTNGTSYSYRVLALVDGKWSGVSATVTAKPKA